MSVPFPIARISTVISRKGCSFLRTSRDGKIFKGTNYPAKKKDDTDYCIDNEDNVSFNETTQIVKRKKKGNGFLSSSERFSSKKGIQCSPGPGEYGSFNIGSIEEKIKRKRRNIKVIHTSKINNSSGSYIQKTDGPGPGRYSPEEQYNNDWGMRSSFFASESRRGIFDIEGRTPGPGQYIKLKEGLSEMRNKMPSYFFHRREKSKENPLKKYKINYGDSSEYQYKLINKKGKIKHGEIYPHLTSTSIEKRISSHYCITNTYPKAKKEIIFEHYTYMKPKKQDIFYLSSPRWTKELFGSSFKVPGPAYYFPYK